VKGIKDMAFDTTGTGWFECKKGYTPDPAVLTGLLASENLKHIVVTAAREVELPKTAVCYEVAVAGLG
jgi:hypothetical protein